MSKTAPLGRGRVFCLKGILRAWAVVKIPLEHNPSSLGVKAVMGAEAHVIWGVSSEQTASRPIPSLHILGFRVDLIPGPQQRWWSRSFIHSFVHHQILPQHLLPEPWALGWARAGAAPMRCLTGC